MQDRDADTNGRAAQVGIDARIGKPGAACFCGAVVLALNGPPEEMGYCHCESCRAYSGAPFGAYMLWKSEDVTITTGTELVGSFNRTGMSDRHFCRRCGGHLMTRHPDLGLTDVGAGAVHGIAFAPAVHLNYSEAVLRVHDGVPKLRDFPGEVGGSGERVAE
ncbi:MAG: GFA family protein [Pseudomonadales bacterium]|nr:GFA family protein [Pseudomonadales bacterium]